MATSAWTALLNSAPSPNGTGTMMLLTDGTVMVQGGGSATAVSTWYQLTPDSTGNYGKGTWTQLTSMHTPRLYYGSNILTDGRVFVQGGEYTNQGQVWTRTGEIFDPVAGTWKTITNFPKSQFGDDPSQVLPDGTVLCGYLSGPQTYIYNPSTNAWHFAANKMRTDQSDEEGWVKLPDGSILSYDVWASISSGSGSAQRYVPSSNKWVDAGSVPVALSSGGVGDELGPCFLLPDGRAFVIGATGNTALYTPSTNTWAAGPTIPGGMGADDAPGAVLPNGHVIFAADVPLFSSPTKIFDFDPVANSITQVITPAALTNVLNVNPSYVDRMLVLPSGKLLLGDASDRLWVYSPTGSAQSSWKPTVQSVVNNGNGTYTLTGTQLNGLDEGAAYGDDAEMSSNYPIVRLKNAAGTIYYCRTSGWSSTGVATGTTVETVNFTLPSGLPSGSYSLYAVANGIASSAFSFTAPGVGPSAPSGAGTGSAAAESSGGTPAANLGAAQSVAVSALAATSGTATRMDSAQSAAVSAWLVTAGTSANPRGAGTSPIGSGSFTVAAVGSTNMVASVGVEGNATTQAMLSSRWTTATDLAFAEAGWLGDLGYEEPN
jgi:hypothetical protein